MQQNKDELREWAVARRRGMDTATLSRRIAARLSALPELQQAKRILIYLATPGEINIEGILTAFPAGAKQWFAPRCAPKRRLAIHSYTPGETTLCQGPFGIREPDAAHSAEAEPETLDIVLVPALLLTLSGERLGYGGGYYDRLLPRLRFDCVTIGALPSALIVPELPQDSWDIRLDRVVSETDIGRGAQPMRRLTEEKDFK